MIENDFTELEKIYIKKADIDISNIGLEEWIELTKKAYEWCYIMRKNYVGDVFNDKSSFLEFLKNCEI